MFDESNIKIFSSRDRIRSHLIDHMKDYLELDDIDMDQSSYLSYLINITSVLSSNLIYYNSSVWREFFLTKALYILIKSLMRESSLSTSRSFGLCIRCSMAGKRYLTASSPSL